MRICFKNLKPCPFSIEEKPKTAFVFMPFKKELQDVYIRGIKETFEDLGWACHRSDEKFDAPEVICTICKNAQEASLIIADLTGRNPNVFLEVGLAFGLEKHVVFLSQDSEDIPFDAKTFRTIMYDPRELPDLRQEIRKLIKSIKITPRLHKEPLFERRYAELTRIGGVPPKPLMELFIGATSETKEWLPRTPENLDLMRCIPRLFAIETVTPRKKHFEFKSKKPGVFVRMYYTGFFHCIIPWWEINPEDQGAKEYHLHWIIQEIAEPLYFLARIMKKKGVKTEQTLKVDLHGISGLQVFPFSRPHGLLSLYSRREWSFSEDENLFSYQGIFNPKEKLVSLFRILCEIYRDICIDLGIIDLKDEEVSQNVEKIVRSMHTLTTTYSGPGLQRLSLEEILGEQNK